MGRIKTGILLLAALLWALPSRAQEPFNPATLLQGRSPSVMVSPVTGCNGEDLSVLVRGGSGIRGDRQPVWIVDGVEINPSVSFLNLYDITDIKVLTNLSDVAPYGDRGANGVVLVTTGARRSEDPLSIRWNSDIGLSFPVLKITGTAPRLQPQSLCVPVWQDHPFRVRRIRMVPPDGRYGAPRQRPCRRSPDPV